MMTEAQGGRGGRRGMALPIILIALFVFSIIMFAIAQQQQHETRYTAISLEQQRAFILADAGIARALARYIARPYRNRWYGDPPGLKDDALPALNHAGRFDEASQLTDETGAGGAPTGTQKLEPNGTYAVMVEDRHAGELLGAEPDAQSRLGFTDVYSKGTIDGPHGPVSVVLYARLAIAPEPSFFDASTTVTPTYGVDESSPELVKRMIRYKAYFKPEIVSGGFQNPGPDSVAVQTEVRAEIREFHRNFLKNRDTFADLRDPTKVNATWHQDTATTRPQWTPDQIKGLFTGIRGPATGPSGTSAPDAPDGSHHNLWTDHMLRRYRVSDLVPANTGIKYLIGNKPDQTQNNIVRNILGAFHPDVEFKPIPEDFVEPGTVETGDRFLELQGPEQTNTAQARIAYNTNVACFVRFETGATVLPGHWCPFPTPNTTLTAEQIACRGKTPQDPGHYANRFQSSEVLTPAIVEEMRAENRRVEALGSDPISDSEFINSPEPTKLPSPYYLRYAGAGGQPPPSPPPPPPGVTDAPPTAQLSIPELVRLYLKYIETSAIFSAGSPGTPFPVPSPPTTPPTNAPPPAPSGPPGGGGNNNQPGGGGRTPGTRIGGGGAGT